MSGISSKRKGDVENFFLKERLNFLFSFQVKAPWREAWLKKNLTKSMSGKCNIFLCKIIDGESKVKVDRK